MTGTNTQLSIYDLIQPVIVPLFGVGDDVYVRSLDVVLSGVIESSWICKTIEDTPYYGYRVKFHNGCYDCIWDNNLGDTVFTDIGAARESADKAGRLLHKINPETLQFSELISYEYIRECDGHKLSATLAKVGDNQLYEHEFMCYHFLRNYDNRKKRDENYRKLFSKIFKEAEHFNAQEINPPLLDTLYKVNDNLFASRQFTEFNTQKR